MKQLIFSLFAAFVLSTGFTSAPVETSKDNWVYNVKFRPDALEFRKKNAKIEKSNYIDVWYACMSCTGACDGRIYYGAYIDAVNYDRYAWIKFDLSGSNQGTTYEKMDFIPAYSDDYGSATQAIFNCTTVVTSTSRSWIG